jgi:thioredoxin reductase (NADPH)
MFYAIGHVPNTVFLDGQLETDAAWYIKTFGHMSTATSVSWVFAGGDVQDKKYRQAITSAGTWCMAALEVEHWLQDNK